MLRWLHFLVCEFNVDISHFNHVGPRTLTNRDLSIVPNAIESEIDKLTGSKWTLSAEVNLTKNIYSATLTNYPIILH